jgi:hypothetical protein
VARKRQARRCSAHRTSGEACGNYAIRGGYVCVAHGGRAPQVRGKAATRLVRASMYRQMKADAELHRRDVVRWRVDQILTTASLLDMDVEDVGHAEILRCYVLSGGEAFSLQEPPRRRDRRYGPRNGYPTLRL